MTYLVQIIQSKIVHSREYKAKKRRERLDGREKKAESREQRAGRVDLP
jgi:hypothetical protein